MKYIKAWFRNVYSLPTILFILLVVALILIPDPQPVTRGVDHPVATEVNQAELAAALERFDLEAADSRATIGVESEPYELKEVGTFLIFWYCPCTKCTDGDGITATQTVATEGVTCAADWSLYPPGTELYIEGIGWRIVEDNGGKDIRGNVLDIFIGSHEEANKNGRSYRRVYVKEAIS